MYVNTISTQSEQDIGVIKETSSEYYFDYSFANISNMHRQGLLHRDMEDDLLQDMVVKEDFATEHGIKAGDPLQISHIIFGVLFGLFIGFIFTYLISMFDPGSLSFHFLLILVMTILIFVIAYMILVPFANHLGKLNISEELMRDNK